MVGACAAQSRRVDLIPGLHPACCPAARMSRNAASGLPGLGIQGDGDVLLCLDREGDFIRNNNLPLRNRYRGFSTKRNAHKRRRLNSSNASLSASRQTHTRSRNGQVAASKGIGNGNLDLLGVESHVHGLAERRIFENSAS